LRWVNQSENSTNRIKNLNTSSKYLGVSFRKSSQKWQAAIMKDGKYKYLGSFESETSAARAYNKEAIKLHGEFATLNDVPPSTNPFQMKKQQDKFQKDNYSTYAFIDDES
jgi:hypothetical protein